MGSPSKESIDGGAVPFSAHLETAYRMTFGAFMSFVFSYGSFPNAIPPDYKWLVGLFGSIISMKVPTFAVAWLVMIPVMYCTVFFALASATMILAAATKSDGALVGVFTVWSLWIAGLRYGKAAKATYILGQILVLLVAMVAIGAAELVQNGIVITISLEALRSIINSTKPDLELPDLDLDLLPQNVTIDLGQLAKEKLESLASKFLELLALVYERLTGDDPSDGLDIPIDRGPFEGQTAHIDKDGDTIIISIEGGLWLVRSLWTWSGLDNPLAAIQNFLVALSWAMLCAFMVPILPPIRTVRRVISRSLLPNALRDAAQSIAAKTSSADDAYDTREEEEQDRLERLVELVGVLDGGKLALATAFEPRLLDYRFGPPECTWMKLKDLACATESAVIKALALQSLPPCNPEVHRSAAAALEAAADALEEGVRPMKIIGGSSDTKGGSAKEKGSPDVNNEDESPKEESREEDNGPDMVGRTNDDGDENAPKNEETPVKKSIPDALKDDEIEEVKNDEESPVEVSLETAERIQGVGNEDVKPDSETPLGERVTDGITRSTESNADDEKPLENVDVDTGVIEDVKSSRMSRVDTHFQQDDDHMNLLELAAQVTETTDAWFASLTGDTDTTPKEGTKNFLLNTALWAGPSLAFFARLTQLLFAPFLPSTYKKKGNATKLVNYFKFAVGFMALVCMSVYWDEYRNLEVLHVGDDENSPIQLESAPPGSFSGWSLIAYSFATMPTVEGTVKKCLLRIAGTLLGAFSAWLALLCSSDNAYGMVAWLTVTTFWANLVSIDTDDPLKARLGQSKDFGYGGFYFVLTQSVITMEFLGGVGERNDLVVDRIVSNLVGILLAALMAVIPPTLSGANPFHAQLLLKEQRAGISGCVRQLFDGDSDGLDEVRKSFLDQSGEKRSEAQRLLEDAVRLSWVPFYRVDDKLVAELKSMTVTSSFINYLLSAADEIICDENQRSAFVEGSKARDHLGAILSDLDADRTGGDVAETEKLADVEEEAQGAKKSTITEVGAEHLSSGSTGWFVQGVDIVVDRMNSHESVLSTVEWGFFPKTTLSNWTTPLFTFPTNRLETTTRNRLENTSNE